MRKGSFLCYPVRKAVSPNVGSVCLDKLVNKDFLESNSETIKGLTQLFSTSLRL